MQLKNKNSSTFILSKKYLGKGLTIIVSQGFKYNHDDLFNNQQHRFLKGGSASLAGKRTAPTLKLVATLIGQPALSRNIALKQRSLSLIL